MAIDSNCAVFPTLKTMVKASIDSILVDYNYIITFLAITNERDYVFIVEVRNQLKLNQKNPSILNELSGHEVR